MCYAYFYTKSQKVNNCLDSQDALAFEISLHKQNFAQFGWLTITVTMSAIIYSQINTTTVDAKTQ